MDDQNGHLHFGGGAASTLLPVSAFSAYSLLRNCNYLLSSQAPDIPSKEFLPAPRISSDQSTKSVLKEDALIIDREKSFFNMTPKSFLTAPLFGYPHPLHILQSDPPADPRSSNVISPCSSLYGPNFRRQRGEKKPIPEEQKDEKYFERRRRNNQAAKKSRDARKIREDQIALRATILEHENALLRAQVLTLREETSSLRQMLLQKKALEFSSRDSQICR